MADAFPRGSATSNPDSFCVAPETAFADQLDAILPAAGLRQLTWQPVPESEARQHERELWDSIK